MGSSKHIHPAVAAVVGEPGLALIGLNQPIAVEREVAVAVAEPWKVDLTQRLEANFE